VYKALKMGVLGVAIIGLGITLMVDPGMRANPKEFTLNDATAGLAVVLVGVILVGLAALVFWRK
jgi:hypothetical protein